MTNFAAITRNREGSSAKVTIAVRWLHSLVTDMTPSTGSRIAIGVFMPCRKSTNFGCRTFWPSDDRQLDDQDQQREHGDGDQQPPAGAGVDQLAQLDRTEPSEGNPGVSETSMVVGGDCVLMPGPPSEPGRERPRAGCRR